MKASQPSRDRRRAGRAVRRARRHAAAILSARGFARPEDALRRSAVLTVSLHIQTAAFIKALRAFAAVWNTSPRKQLIHNGRKP